jgi:hypothetical protein
MGTQVTLSASQKGTFPCLSSKYKTCDFVDSSTIVSAPKSEYHIKHHFTCASSHSHLLHLLQQTWHALHWGNWPEDV